jgi:hypothetical protein
MVVFQGHDVHAQEVSKQFESRFRNLVGVMKTDKRGHTLEYNTIPPTQPTNL